MPTDDTHDFGKYLAEIAEKQIPVQFVSAVTVIFKNGKRSRLSREDLLTPLPLDKGLTWNKVEEGFDGVENVEIHIDLEALAKHIGDKTESLLDKHFNNSEKE
jgi:hypothetical protein